MSLIIGLLVSQLLTAAAQGPEVTVLVLVRSQKAVIDGAEVVVRGVSHRTDATGRVTVTSQPGSIEFTVRKDGFATALTSVQLAAGPPQEVVIDLEPLPTVEEEVTVVGATRTDKRLEDQPMRVEVLAREEIEEKLMMTPGDIVMMLNEMGGMRVQATSPSLGAASVRIQGMRGRYTRVLSDGLPLFGDVGGLGLLQIPPMDLGQVEVIKGVASALYGAGAMGGVVNLVSRRPTDALQREFLVNQSTRGATDAVTFLSGPLTGGWTASLLGGGHWQHTNDVNHDAWADLPGYARAVVRPRLFWGDGRGRTFFATAGLTFEDRNGGTPDGERLVPTGSAYREALQTDRYDAGAVGQVVLGNRHVVTGRAAFARQNHDHQFGETIERDHHETAFGELAVRGIAGRQTWVVGGAVERDLFSPRDVPQFAYRFLVPGGFAQYDLDVNRALALSLSGRVDRHSEYGTFFSPRISILTRAGKWSSRLSVGTGFFGSTPITEETEAAGLTRLKVRLKPDTTYDGLKPDTTYNQDAGYEQDSLQAERGLSGSFDVSRTAGALSLTATLFASRITDPLHVERTATFVLRNLPDPTSNVGAELLGTWRQPPFSITSTYTYVRARETVDGVREDVPLTPRHSAGVVGMWEVENAGRAGIEWYYTGNQRLEENAFRTVSRPYFVVGLLVERIIGRTRIFVNGENLTGVRQTQFDPLVRPTRGVDGRWTVDAWAPLEGRNINGGLRIKF